MNVKQIKALACTDLRHFNRQRQGVIRTGKNAVLPHRHLMEVNSRRG
jgi:hypothetical protein